MLKNRRKPTDEPVSTILGGIYSISRHTVDKHQSRQLVFAVRRGFYTIAARTAIKDGKQDVAKGLITRVPQEQLRGPLAEIAIKMLTETDPSAAFALATTVIRQDITLPVLSQAADLANALSRKNELVAAVMESNNLEYLASSPDMYDRLMKMGLEEVVRAIPEMRSRRRR